MCRTQCTRRFDQPVLRMAVTGIRSPKRTRIAVSMPVASSPDSVAILRGSRVRDRYRQGRGAGSARLMPFAASSSATPAAGATGDRVVLEGDQGRVAAGQVENHRFVQRLDEAHVDHGQAAAPRPPGSAGASSAPNASRAIPWPRRRSSALPIGRVVKRRVDGHAGTACRADSARRPGPGAGSRCSASAGIRFRRRGP